MKKLFKTLFLIAFLSGSIASAKDGLTPLMSAAMNGDLKTVSKLLNKKTDLEAKTASGNTALALAINADEYEAADLLIKAGANVDIIVNDQTKDTALMVAATSNLNTTKLILSKNKDVINKTNAKGETALSKALYFGNYNIAKVLLEAGADKTIKNKDGQTVLDIAKKEKNSEAMKLLSSNK
ncbi:ankyrin repeat domain-containing protein [Bdellovibrio bacteriovorus]